MGSIRPPPTGISRFVGNLLCHKEELSHRIKLENDYLEEFEIMSEDELKEIIEIWDGMLLKN